MKKKRTLLLTAGLFFVLITKIACADSIVNFDLVGHNYAYNTANVSFAYDFDSVSNFGEVNISIENTGLYDPIITGFAFNTPPEITDLLNFSGPVGMEAIFKNDAIKTPEPFGLFDASYISGKNLAGGDPKYGIPQGETFEFMIQFLGNDLEKLTAESFLSQLSLTTKLSETAVSFLARVQQVGPSGEFSDVMIPEHQNPVPEPTTMLLFGTGLVGLVSTRLRKKSKE